MTIILKTFDSIEEIEIKQGETVKKIYEKYELNPQLIYLTSNGKRIKQDDSLFIYDTCIIQFNFILNGGKGGFGSLLKGQPAVKKQTKNFDACRDISGRRLRHVNQEKQILEWQQKKEEEEKIIQKYNQAGKEDEIRMKLYEDKKNDLVKQNKKFFAEENRTKNSIKKSINKFLNKKRQKPINNEKKLNNENNSKNSPTNKTILLEVKQNKLSKDELLSLILD